MTDALEDDQPLIPQPRDYEVAVDRAMADCWKCERLTPIEREAHKMQALRDILATQTRTPPLLPESAWPAGRPGTISLRRKEAR